MSDIEDEQVISGEEGIDQIDIDIIDADDEAPIIRLVNAILNQAVKARASDIHIEPFDRHIAVRFRIDGVMSEILQPQKFHASISSRIKVMSRHCGKARIPQDGRIKIKVAGKDIDIVFLHGLPTNFGERLVMRLLDKSNVLQDLGHLGMDAAVLDNVHELLGKSYGIILVTGQLVAVKQVRSTHVWRRSTVQYETSSLSRTPLNTSSTALVKFRQMQK